MDEIYEFIIKVGKNFLGFSLGALLIGGTSYLVTKYFKYIFFAIIGCVAFYLVAASINELRGQFLAFRFENFKDEDELSLFLKEKFPPGSDTLALKHMIEEAGAKCEMYDKFNRSTWGGTPKNLKYAYYCDYNSGFLSFYFLKGYDVNIYADVQQKLLKVNVSKMEGLYL